MIARATNAARYPLPVRRIPAYAVALTLGLIGAPSGPAIAAVEHSCGPARTAIDPPQEIRATGVSCGAARALARKHSRMSGRYDVCALAKRSCRLDRYTCTRTFYANGRTRVRCLRGAKRVRFVYGS